MRRFSGARVLCEQLSVLVFCSVLFVFACAPSCTSHTQTGRVQQQSFRTISLENMIWSTDKKNIYVLEMGFSRTDEKAVDRVDISCDVGGVRLSGKPHNSAPGNRRYQAYLFTDRASSKKLKEGEQDVDCKVGLDGESYTVKGRAYIAGPPLGTPFTMLTPALVAMDCDTGAAPEQGKPMCVHLRTYNRNMMFSKPKEEVTAQCEVGGEVAETRRPLGYFSRPYVEVRFERAPKAGSHEVKCQILGYEETKTRFTFKVVDTSPVIALELLEVKDVALSPRLFVRYESNIPSTRGLHAKLKVRAKGQAALWNIQARCTALEPRPEMMYPSGWPASKKGVVLSGWWEAGYKSWRSQDGKVVPEPLQVGEEKIVEVRAELSGKVKAFETRELKCVAEARARDRKRVLATSNEISVAVSTKVP